MKRILFITPSLGGGGAERRIVNLSVLFAERGYDVTILGYTPVNLYSAQLEKAGVHLVWKSGGYIQRMFRIPWYIITNGFDATISLLPTPGLLNCVAAMVRKGKRVVITGESSSNEGQFYSKKGKIYARMQRFSDHIICNSFNAKNMWLKYYPEYGNRIKVIYNPVLLAEHSSDYCPKENGIFHVIVPSSVYRLKNPLGLIEALILMSPDERAMVQIDWYGRKSTTKTDGDDYFEAIRLIEAHHLEKSLIFHDPTTDILSKVASADAVALFSQLEGLPNAICEGMMMGKPIIMTKVSDYRDLVDDSNGILCEWDKPHTIKNALIRMASMTEMELDMLGQASKEKASHLFDAEFVIDKWIELVENKFLEC